MVVIYKDILTVEKGIITHQVNCQRQMGAGLARKIRDRYPKVYEEYKSIPWRLGQIQIVRIDKDLFVCNLAGQNNFGKSVYRYTDYNAVRTGFKDLNDWRKEFRPDLNIYIPYRMGCDLGGGNWNTYLRIVGEECNGVIICKLENGTG